MWSRWNLIGAGFAVLLACVSLFVRHSGSAATGLELAGTLSRDADKVVVAQNADNGAKPAPRPAAKPKALAPKPVVPAAPEAEGATPSPGTAQAPVPEAGPNPLGELQPVLHAQGAKITTCMDTIISQASGVIDTAHTAISTWVTSAPNENAFQSTVGLSYPSKAAPNAAAILFAAPVGSGRCEGETVQISIRPRKPAALCRPISSRRGAPSRRSRRCPWSRRRRARATFCCRARAAAASLSRSG